MRYDHLQITPFGKGTLFKYLMNVSFRFAVLVSYPALAGLMYLLGKPIQCGVREKFGILCPGCGLTTMCLALLRFDVVAAFNANMFIFLTLPLISYYSAVFVFYGEVRHEEVLISYAGGMILYAVIRNLIGGV